MIAKYYTRITTSRLLQLLDLSELVWPHVRLLTPLSLAPPLYQ